MSEIGERIREAAKSCGTVERMAELAGIPRRTLYNYIKGPREPKAAQLAAISKVTNARLEWLITGQEPKEIAAPRWRSPEAEDELLISISAMVKDIYDHAGVDLPSRGLAKTAREALTNIIRTLDAQAGPDEIESALQLQAARLRRELSDASAEPGKGKRSASS